MTHNAVAPTNIHLPSAFHSVRMYVRFWQTQFAFLETSVQAAVYVSSVWSNPKSEVVFGSAEVKL